MSSTPLVRKRVIAPVSNCGSTSHLHSSGFIVVLCARPGRSDRIRTAAIWLEEQSSIAASSVSSIPPRSRRKLEEHSSIKTIFVVLFLLSRPGGGGGLRSTAPSKPDLSLLSRPGGGGGLRSTAPSKPVSTHLYRARITALRSRMQCGVQAVVPSCRGNQPSCLRICTTQHSERRSIGSQCPIRP